MEARRLKEGLSEAQAHLTQHQDLHCLAMATIFLLSSASVPELVAMSGASAPCDDDVVVFMHGARRKNGTHTDVAVSAQWYSGVM